MSDTSKYNFPNVQKVQIFEQVDTYIENNYIKGDYVAGDKIQGDKIMGSQHNIDKVGNLNTGNVDIQGDQIGIEQPEPPK
jgi:hypothetical protein